MRVGVSKGFKLPNNAKTRHRQQQRENQTIHQKGQSLADEVLVSIEDTMVETQLEYLMRRLEPIDYQLMKRIKEAGPIYHKKVYEEFDNDVGKKILTRLKSRAIISPVRDPESGYSKYDMNEIGFEILKALETDKPSEVFTISTNSNNIY